MAKTFKQFVAEVIVVPKRKKTKEKEPMYVPPGHKDSDDFRYGFKPPVDSKNTKK